MAFLDTTRFDRLPEAEILRRIGALLATAIVRSGRLRPRNAKVRVNRGNAPASRIDPLRLLADPLERQIAEYLRFTGAASPGELRRALGLRPRSPGCVAVGCAKSSARRAPHAINYAAISGGTERGGSDQSARRQLRCGGKDLGVVGLDQRTMRLLHVTDFHFRQRWFHWLAAHAVNYDACCLTGDFLEMFPGSQTGLRTQARWVRDWLREFPAPLYACTGNHDWWPKDERVIDDDAEGGWLRPAARPGLVFDGATDHRDGYHFTCCPWAQTPAVECMIPSVVLVHAPPLATSVSSEMGSEAGDPDVAAVIGKMAPGSLVLSGHVHQPRRWHARIGPAWCFNPGVDFSRDVPNHIVIDTAAKEATFRGWGREIGPMRWADAD